MIVSSIDLLESVDKVPYRRCPICVEKYYQLTSAGRVCNEHQEWLVTRCQECHRACFSQTAGLCIECENMIRARVEQELRDLDNAARI